MTPRACSLYDSIKLKKLKNGYAELSDFGSREGKGIAELILNGWVKVKRFRASKHEPIVEYIELLR